MYVLSDGFLIIAVQGLVKVVISATSAKSHDLHCSRETKENQQFKTVIEQLSRWSSTNKVFLSPLSIHYRVLQRATSVLHLLSI